MRVFLCLCGKTIYATTLESNKRKNSFSALVAALDSGVNMNLNDTSWSERLKDITKLLQVELFILVKLFQMEV